jgi:3-dehydroquinate synthase
MDAPVPYPLGGSTVIHRTSKVTSSVAPGKKNGMQSRMSGESNHESDFDATTPFGVEWKHVLRFTTSAFEIENRSLADCLAESTEQPAERRMIAVIDDGVAQTHPSIREHLAGYVAAHSDRVPRLMEVLDAPGGEVAKQDEALVSRILDSIDHHGICRKSVVLVIGGGAVLDAAGYATAIAHRGVRLVRMPSTVLGQCDSGVGVKNGINRFGKKNFTGTFCPPNAVLCDQSLLNSLSEADWSSGFSEIVKIALLRDKALLEEMERLAPSVVDRKVDVVMPLIARSAHLHMEHITRGGDPFELNEARPLDFGHWSAHKLEQMSDFQLRHGHAVSIGIALDMVYAGRIGVTEKPLVERTLRLLVSLGLPIACEQLADAEGLLKGLEEFREHLGGQLTITMVREPGVPVDLHEIDSTEMAEAILELLHRSKQLQQDRFSNS